MKANNINTHSGITAMEYIHINYFQQQAFKYNDKNIIANYTK